MSRHAKLSLLALAILLLAALFATPVKRVRTLMSLREAIAPHGQMSVDVRPLPFIDQRLLDGVLQSSGHPFSTALDHNTPRPFIECMLGGSVRGVVIDEVDPLSSRIANLIVTFPKLEFVAVAERYDGAHAAESEWNSTIKSLSAVTTLQGLSLEGREISDATLLPLASHPSLTNLSLNSDRLSLACCATLSSLSQVEEFKFQHNTTASAADWIAFCAAIRKLPKLNRITLAGDHLTDAAIAELAGHATIDTIRIWNHSLTPACAATFATLPKLIYIEFDTKIAGFTSAEENAITAALPRKQRVYFRATGFADRFK